MDLVSVTTGLMNRYLLSFAGQPLFMGETWQETANAAIKGGFATFAFGVIFTLVPGASIKAAH